MENINISYMGSVFKNARRSANLTQEEVAERIGVTARYIMALKNEGKRPWLDFLLKNSVNKHSGYEIVLS